MKRKSPSPHSAHAKDSRKIPLPEPGRLRRIPQHFSWIDHRLVRHGHLRQCGDTSALALYLFLVTVGDSRGLSYYSEKRLIEHLALSVAEVRSARNRLIDAGLIAYRKPFYQVLSLDGIDAVAAVREVGRACPEPSPAPAPAHNQSEPSRRRTSAEDEEGERFENPVTIREALRETLKMLGSRGETKS